MRRVFLFVGAALCAIAQASLQIIPGGTWTAPNTGKHIQAHGAGIIKVGSTFFWLGEDKTNGSAFQNVNCYSSTDLVQWTYVGAALTRQASGDLGPNRVVERPKVVFNKNTNQYVMWMHIDDSSYAEAKVGVATSPTVCGAYTYRGSFQPLGFQSRDMSLFQDDDGSVYLLSEDRPNGLRINKLSADYLSVASSTFLFPDHIEAPAMLKQNGRYYLFGSHLTGWDPNDNVYVTATSLSGPWSAWTTFAQVGSNTYSSQTAFILPITSTSAMYLGDRWVSTNLMRSTYVWLPLTISGTTVTMNNAVNWIVNVATGSMTPGPTETSDEGESATLSNGAKSVSCSGCSGSLAAGFIGGPTNGGALFSSVSSTVSTRTTIRVKYENGDTSQRFASVSCNGVSQRLAFLPGDDGNTPASSSLNCDLKAGTNTVSITGLGDGTWGPDIDRLFVPIT